MNTSSLDTAQRAVPEKDSNPDEPRPTSPNSVEFGSTGSLSVISDLQHPQAESPRTSHQRRHRRHPATIDLDEDFFDRGLLTDEMGNTNTRLPERIDSPIDTRATEVSLSSSWLSLSAAGSGQSSLGPSRRASPRVLEEGSTAGGVGMGMEGGSWIDAEISSDGRIGMGTAARHGDKEEEMSSIDKVNAWFRPGDVERGRRLEGLQDDGGDGGDHDGSGHNSNLVFPRLDASVGPGTDSYDTIKAFKSSTTATRFDRSFSQSTVKMTSPASYAPSAQTELHRSFLSDLADPEGSAKYSHDDDDDHVDDDTDDMFRLGGLGSGVEVQSDVISSSDLQGSIEGEDEWDLGEVEDRLEGGQGVERGVNSDRPFLSDLPRYEAGVGGASRGLRPSEKEKIIAKYWMEKVASGVDDGTVDPLAWKSVVQKRDRLAIDQPDRRVGRYDRMRRITLLLVPFIALTAVALLSGTSIERMLFPAKSDAAPHSPATSSAPAVTRVAEMKAGTQPGPSAVRTDLRECTALVLVGEVEPEAPRPSKAVPVQPVVASAKDAVASTRLEAARAHMARLAQTVPAHITIPSFAPYQESLHFAAKQAQRAIHKASVALVGTIMQVPRGLTRARARFALWFDPKLKRTTDVVVADGKAAWSLVIIGAKTGFDKTSENVARALSDFRTSSVRRTNQIATSAYRVGQGVANARHSATEHVVSGARRVRSGQLALVKASVTRGTYASNQISSKLQDASAALLSRLERYSELTRLRMASIKTRRPLRSQLRANHKTAHYEKRKRRTSRK